MITTASEALQPLRTEANIFSLALVSARSDSLPLEASLANDPRPTPARALVEMENEGVLPMY